MKKFIIKTIVFLLPLLIILLPLEWGVRNYSTVMKQKQKYLSKKGNLIELLILGNSHAGDGIDPSQFSLNAFNAAQGSQSLFYDIAITKKFLKSMISLKYVLISVDYHSLYFQYAPQREFMYSYYYGINYDANFKETNYTSLLLSGYGFKNGLKLLAKENKKTKKGWVGYNKTNYSKLNKIAGKKRAETFNKLIYKNMSYKNKILDALEQFISLLKSKNVNPVLITLPCHDHFNRFLDKKIVRQNKIDTFEICRKHNISYLDFSNERLPDSCFYNIGVV
jgi:hypothetical protein